jgi:hypothetical protein
MVTEASKYLHTPYDLNFRIVIIKGFKPHHFDVGVCVRRQAPEIFFGKKVVKRVCKISASTCDCAWAPTTASRVLTSLCHWGNWEGYETGTIGVVYMG